MKFEVKTKFIFSGSFFIEAGNKEQAREYVEKRCRLVLGGDIHTTLPYDEVDWDFHVHPDKVIGRITKKVEPFSKKA